ncbi:General secretion pathway protein K [hydrothermal vent metagenome]|uniref:General secretion pathway protein K n=1 Tax=hydrothermal vent metagenome TaxID=652676 RepID=A0A3B0WG28_9ZZZZ
MFSPRSKNLFSTPAKQQKGVAIITALLIVTIAATVSITISTRLQLDVRRTSNLITQDQAQFYLLAAEEWSQRILREDKKNTSIDALDEQWAFELPPLPVDGGSIQGRLTDLHACLNVNSLIKDNAIAPIPKARLSQLFKNLKVKVDLTQAIGDWIDSNLETTNPNGAEDGYYLNLAKPYRTANTPLHSISELRLIKGFEDRTIYPLVKPYLCAFIIDGGDINININTASAEVLQSLSETMTKSLAADIIERRTDTPFSDLKDFTSFAKLDTIIKDTEQLSTSSNYFLLRTHAIIGQANKVMYSIIFRDDSGKTKIISRTQRTQ